MNTSTKTHDVSIILVGLNARDFVKGCLDSILQADWRNKTYEVVYSDNGSTDGSVELIRSEYAWVKVLENGENLGFCKAANLGAKASNSRYYYFINDDTLVLRDAIAMLVDYMDENKAVATTGSRLLYPDMTEQYSGRGFPTLLSAFMGRRSPLTNLFPNAPWVRRYLCKDGLEAGQPFDVDWVSAAGQIVRPAIFWEVGGFAEDYYYWHEAVICSRFKKRGHRVVLHPESKIIHYEGKGSGSRRSYQVQKFHIVDFHRGAYRAYRNHYGLSSLHPGGIMVGLMLSSRALAMLTVARLKTALG